MDWNLPEIAGKLDVESPEAYCLSEQQHQELLQGQGRKVIQVMVPAAGKSQGEEPRDAGMPRVQALRGDFGEVFGGEGRGTRGSRGRGERGEGGERKDAGNTTLVGTRGPQKHWPKRENGGLLSCRLRLLDDPSLPPLLCSGWRLRPGEEFNFLSTGVRAGMRRVLEQWVERMGVLGQDQNVLFECSRFQVELHRPLLTHWTAERVCLHYLNGPLQVHWL